jgi:hypothetical protein
MRIAPCTASETPEVIKDITKCEAQGLGGRTKAHLCCCPWLGNGLQLKPQERKDADDVLRASPRMRAILTSLPSVTLISDQKSPQSLIKSPVSPQVPQIPG